MTAELKRVLEEVQHSLRLGDLAALPRLTRSMEEAEVLARDISAADLLAIRDLADRNARTLLAARRGVKAARRRVEEVIAASRGLVTYDGQGHRVEESDHRTLAKRF